MKSWCDTAPISAATNVTRWSWVYGWYQGCEIASSLLSITILGQFNIDTSVRFEHHLVVKHFLIPGWNWSEFFIHVKDEFVKPSTEESMAVNSSNISCDNHIKHFIVKPTLIRIKNIKSCFIKVISSSTSLISICLSAIMRTPGHFFCYGTLLEPKHGVLIMYSRALFKITSYLR